MSARSVILNSNNWEQFNQNLLELNKKEKGNAFELFTKAYFKAHPVYRFYDEVWLLDEVPTNELKKLGIPSQDLGIDLIAKNGKEYHAIQCKYHTDKNKSVSYKEVSTFLTMLGNSSFSQGYICSSANGTSKNLDKVKTKPISYILSDTWSNIDEALFSDIQNYLEGKSFKPQPFEPRNHQVKAIKEAKEHFKKESRGKLIFPCGAGKSLTGFWFTQELESKNTLIAVPSLSLIKQTLDVYLREIVANKKKVKWLCICSDDGIGRDDDIVFKTENIGVPCQTDPLYIENWLKENKDENKIIFTTYQSGKIIAELSKKLKMSFDLGIFDEAHKTVGSSKKLFSHLLFEKNISIEKRIFMTATERFYGGQKSEDIISMDDEDIYGDTFSMMTFKEAINADLLTDYKVITIDVKKKEISDFIRENKLVELNGNWAKESESRALASMLALRKAMTLFPITNAVSFHSSIERAKRNLSLQDYITETYNYEPIDTFTVKGKDPTSLRSKIISEFAESKKALITNARCLTEGIDVPNIDCIIFTDPKRSKVDIVQALGRALRKKEDKDWGYVILPVIYDDKTNEIDNDNFNDILSVVRGLAANDERIVDYFKFKESERLEKSKAGERIFNFEVFSEYIDEGELKENLQIKLWDKLSRFEWMPFEEARTYIRSFNFKSTNEFRMWKKKSSDIINIPSTPDEIYKDEGWISFGDWLGTGYVATYSREYLPFEKARKFVRKLELKSGRQWKEYCKSGNKPVNIPTAANQIYNGKGWISISDWLGYNGNKKSSDYLSYEQAKEFVKKINIRSKSEWNEYIKSPEFPINLPKYPKYTYRNRGWVNLRDFYGDKYNSREYLKYDDAKAYVRKLNIINIKKWQEYCKSVKKPSNIPNWPNGVYKNKGWINWSDFLGTKIVSPQNMVFVDFYEAKKTAKQFGLKSYKEWVQYCRSGKKPNKIPSNPNSKYMGEGWKGWPDFLGYELNRKKPHKPAYTFEEARSFVRVLKLKGNREWRVYSKSSEKPKLLPASPQKRYKDKGWKGWDDFLGKEKK